MTKLPPINSDGDRPSTPRWLSTKNSKIAVALLVVSLVLVVVTVVNVIINPGWIDYVGFAIFALFAIQAIASLMYLRKHPKIARH